MVDGPAAPTTPQASTATTTSTPASTTLPTPARPDHALGKAKLSPAADLVRKRPTATADLPTKGMERSAPSTDADAPDMQAPISQPMTASSSSASSAPSAKDHPTSNGTPVAPYGTRSRNRGVPRPNYAEDNHLDAEFEMTPAPKETAAGRKASKASEAAAAVAAPDTSPEGTRPLHTHPRKSIQESDAGWSQSHVYNTVIPGTSSFSANPSTTATTAAINQPSKKRKINQLGAPATAQMPTTNNGVARKAGTALQSVANGWSHMTNMMSFDDCGHKLQDDKLISDDNVSLEVNDHVYLVCEPPGEPYYMGRIMEFIHADNDSTREVESLRLNWFYRPKDIGRRTTDFRQVFASMHSDVSPLTSVRGRCHIKLKVEIEDFETYRTQKDCFWFDRLYERYIHRFYDVIPVVQVINVPEDVKRVLDTCWKYVLTEPTRTRELTSAVKTCKRCSKFCANNESVDCAVCGSTFHMSCVSPPLLKKPSRGFAWACAPCSKAQEKKLAARNTPNVTDAMDGDEDEPLEEDEDTGGADSQSAGTNGGNTDAPKEFSIEEYLQAAVLHQELGWWQWRYLGIHCEVESVLDFHDRINPRAASRLGAKHQATVMPWPGRPIEYVKPLADAKRKYHVRRNGEKKDHKPSKEAQAALGAAKARRGARPKYLQDEPVGFVARGEDYDNDDPECTAQLHFAIPEVGGQSADGERGMDDGPLDGMNAEERNQLVDDYMERAKAMAESMGLPKHSTNLMDVALKLLQIANFDPEAALKALKLTKKKVFKEPDLTVAEVQRFEEGVEKYGSEWHSIKQYVKTVSPGAIVRYYYVWKKTESGRAIWNNFQGRKGKKEAKKAEAAASKLQDDVADECDDSAFDNNKAATKKRQFQCKFCQTRQAKAWRRAPNTHPGTMITETVGKGSKQEKGGQFMVALCIRCAEIWRRYAIQYEEPDEVARKVAQASGRGGKRKIDEELLQELVAANDLINQAPDPPPMNVASSASAPTSTTTLEPPRKKRKGSAEKEAADANSEPNAPPPPKKKTTEKAPPPPPVVEPPKPKILPCFVCGELDPLGDDHFSCKECRMAVHRNCYGIVGDFRPGKWTCDMCSNDKNPQVSIQYKCMLCPISSTVHDFVEPPKHTHKKRTEKDKEKDRLDRELAVKNAEYFRKKQEESNKPTNPREPLKRTANNNWVHVTCAVFTPEVKFGNAKAMEPSEGIPSILTARYNDVCKICNAAKGACVACHHCKAPVHVECAHHAGYLLGFDIAPVKGSRRDQFNIVNINGEVGTMTAAIWCKDHVPTKTIVHRMFDIVDGSTGMNALQLFVQTFKQADLALTGTVRKATLVNQSTKVPTPATAASNRRASTNPMVTANPGHRGSISHVKAEGSPESQAVAVKVGASRCCVTCRIEVSPKWWPEPTGSTVTNGHIALATAALHEAAPRHKPVVRLQCHQCHFNKKEREVPMVAMSEARPIQSVVGASPGRDRPQPLPNPQYAPWPPAPSYEPNGSYNPWPRQSPSGQPVHQMNGTPTHVPTGQMNGHPPLRPRSPRQNGHSGASANPQANGYPPSPRVRLGPASHYMTNEPYTSYRSTRPPPQHLTNGGPPPRALDHPLPHHNQNLQPRPSYGPPQGSPPQYREGPPQGSPPQYREVRPHPHPHDLNQNGAARPDGRVNGGASASPSLRNLLS